MRDFYEAAAAARDAHLSINLGPATSAPIARSEKVPAKIYGVMALTTVLTFATLSTGYQFFFTHQLYA